jgi:hypothetical protein
VAKQAPLTRQAGLFIYREIKPESSTDAGPPVGKNIAPMVGNHTLADSQSNAFAGILRAFVMQALEDLEHLINKFIFKPDSIISNGYSVELSLFRYGNVLFFQLTTVDPVTPNGNDRGFIVL